MATHAAFSAMMVAAVMSGNFQSSGGLQSPPIKNKIMEAITKGPIPAPLDRAPLDALRRVVAEFTSQVALAVPGAVLDYAHFPCSFGRTHHPIAHRDICTTFEDVFVKLQSALDEGLGRSMGAISASYPVVHKQLNPVRIGDTHTHMWHDLAGWTRGQVRLCTTAMRFVAVHTAFTVEILDDDEIPELLTTDIYLLGATNNMGGIKPSVDFLTSLPPGTRRLHQLVQCDKRPLPL